MDTVIEYSTRIVKASQVLDIAKPNFFELGSGYHPPKNGRLYAKARAMAGIPPAIYHAGGELLSGYENILFLTKSKRTANLPVALISCHKINPNLAFILLNREHPDRSGIMVAKDKLRKPEILEATLRLNSDKSLPFYGKILFSGDSKSKHVAPYSKIRRFVPFIQTEKLKNIDWLDDIVKNFELSFLASVADIQGSVSLEKPVSLMLSRKRVKSLMKTFPGIENGKF